jgi:hypothetical protein
MHKIYPCKKRVNDYVHISRFMHKSTRFERPRHRIDSLARRSVVCAPDAFTPPPLAATLLNAMKALRGIDKCVSMAHGRLGRLHPRPGWTTLHARSKMLFHERSSWRTPSGKEPHNPLIYFTKKCPASRSEARTKIHRVFAPPSRNKISILKGFLLSSRGKFCG